MSKNEKWGSTLPKRIYEELNEHSNGFVLLRIDEQFSPEVFIQCDGPAIMSALTAYLSEVSKSMLIDDGEFLKELGKFLVSSPVSDIDIHSEMIGGDHFNEDNEKEKYDDDDEDEDLDFLK